MYIYDVVIVILLCIDSHYSLLWRRQRRVKEEGRIVKELTVDDDDCIVDVDAAAAAEMDLGRDVCRPAESWKQVR